MITGMKLRMLCVACTPKMAFEPWPCCQNRTTKPNDAPSEMMLSTTALSASATERNDRASSRKVTSAMIASISGKLP